MKPVGVCGRRRRRSVLPAVPVDSGQAGCAAPVLPTVRPAQSLCPERGVPGCGVGEPMGRGDHPGVPAETIRPALWLCVDAVDSAAGQCAVGHDPPFSDVIPATPTAAVPQQDRPPSASAVPGLGESTASGDWWKQRAAQTPDAVESENQAVLKSPVPKKR